MSDLIERLQRHAALAVTYTLSDSRDSRQLARESLDRIKELEAENAKMREAVEAAKKELRNVAYGPGWVAYRILAAVQEKVDESL